MPPSVEAVIATTFGVPVTDIAATSDMTTLRQWDSVGHINLILALEQEYGVTIDEDAIVELTSVQAIKDFLARASAA
jgi:acyl carrier protein